MSEEQHYLQTNFGYVFEEEVFEKSITDISATKIRQQLREDGALD